MKRILMTAAALASLAFAAAPSTTQAATSVGVSIRIGDPYRGGSFHFRSEPDVVLIPSTRVYYVDDYDYYDEYGYGDFHGDLYHYGSYWYLIDDGYWYRARSYRGPFVHISFRSVPRYVYSVPTRYRRNWGGSYANYGGRWNWYRDSDRRSYTTRNRSYTTRDRNYTTRDRNYTTRDRSYTTPTRDRSYTTRNRSQTRDQNVRYRDNVSTQSRDRSWGGNRTEARRTTDVRSREARAGNRNETQVRENRSRGQNDNSNRGQGRGKGNKGGNGNGKGGK